ncbi:uncharacterized protein K452DRAFT_362117 [Aplosporella prunicola CBS 121167]|uniref:NADP-dependent oxidoreductase domain-containing protein n=1 Tax=Aplosporella prunicola CBS 121167 TaxID=1176127 RepID=A0A6A6AZ69_9PEZI|nr:uncharacterized protein K452DRAFT_362117 [Aplosporella prunicola CBS 121167]KAF2137080.1 hypothetical protein K452DRAFT_362117 [Aplosporella prunicola CBS 121167]
MSFFAPPPPPATPLALHRALSPTAAVKVSPICLGGISLGDKWSSIFGRNDDAFALLDAFVALGGNFIDTANTYNAEESERLIGDWMHERGCRDMMVIATKYGAGYKAYDRERWPLQSNFTGCSAKSLHVSVKESLKKLRTDYIDVLYVHWWDFATGVEEVMTALHALVMARQVLYLGVSDTPAWVVVKANSYARAHGLTPFSVYQGRWNAAFRDMEAEIVPMCADQGMGLVPWGTLGGGQLLSAAQRAERAADPEARQSGGGPENPNDKAVSEALEEIAAQKGVGLQAVALAYLFAQSPHVTPIAGVQTVEHVNALPDALRISLSRADVAKIHAAARFDPLFPMSFLLNYRGDKEFHLGLGTADVQQYQMAAWISGAKDLAGRDLPVGGGEGGR